MLFLFFSSYESDHNTRILFVLISFRFSSESVCNINSTFGNCCVNFFENLQHFFFDVSIGFIVWHWYTMDFQVLSSAILFQFIQLGIQFGIFFFKIPASFLELSIFFFEVIHIASDCGDLFEYIRKLILKRFKFFS